MNATDLTLMKYPRREILMHLGEWAIQQAELTQSKIDEAIGAMAA